MVSEKLLDANMVPNVINIFVPKTIDPERLIAGYTLFGEYIVIQEVYLIDSRDKSVLAHELGHYFGLFHTHGKYNVDSEGCIEITDSLLIPSRLSPQAFCEGITRFDDPLIDSNNDNIPDCAQTGDDVCDTPAEPVLSDLVDANCNYIGTTTDANNEPYKPQIGNIMSYAPSDCITDFTEGQSERMYAFLMEFNQDLLCGTETTTSRRLIPVNNVDDACQGSLRWAVELANYRAGMDTIMFDPNYFSEPKTILLSKELSIGSDIVLIGSDNVIISSRTVFPGLERMIFPRVSVKGNNITLKNLSLVNMPRSGLSINQSSEVTLDKLNISGSNFRGLAILDSEKIKVSDSKFSNNESSGLYAFNSSEITILDTEISKNSFRGVWINSIDQTSILECSIHDNGSTGMYIGNKSKDIDLSQSDFRRNGFYGIEIDEANNINIDAVLSTQSAFNGLAILDSEKIKVSNSEFSNNRFRGLYAFNSSEVEIDNIQFLDNADNGIRLDSVKTTTIRSCNIRGNDRDGVYISRESEGIEFSQSTISNNGFNGVLVSATSSLTISESQIYKNGSNGIIHANFDSEGVDLSLPARVEVNSSTIYENAQAGILDEARKRLLVQNSAFYCNSTAQIDNQNSELIAQITGVTNGGIKGVAIPNSEIFFYQNKDECSSCNASLLLGSAVADVNGNWQFFSAAFEESIELSVTSITVSNEKTSQLADCISLSNFLVDLDNDGYTNINDCDDANASINPTAQEILDNGIDEDCNGTDLRTLLDQDGDGYLEDVDCDDNNASINPGAVEIENSGFDENCDGVSLLIDADQDGYNSSIDCDDNNASINSGASEIPNNGIDEDCNGSDLVTFQDKDGDGYLEDVDCDDNNASINPGAAEIENSGFDENCDGVSLLIDVDQDGWNSSIDCDDNNASINDGALEIPNNGIDEDCNGTDLVTFQDKDGDGYLEDVDCDDNNASVNPAATEIENSGFDENCDGVSLIIDNDQDGWNSSIDCDDNNPNANGAAIEIANNGIDEDCDGQDLVTTSTYQIDNTLIKIYPNPANQFVKIEFMDHRNFKVRLSTLQGKQVVQKENQDIIDVSNFSNGIYLLEISVGKRKIMERISIVK